MASAKSLQSATRSCLYIHVGCAPAVLIQNEGHRHRIDRSANQPHRRVGAEADHALGRAVPHTVAVQPHENVGAHCVVILAVCDGDRQRRIQSEAIGPAQRHPRTIRYRGVISRRGTTRRTTLDYHRCCIHSGCGIEILALSLADIIHACRSSMAKPLAPVLRTAAAVRSSVPGMPADVARIVGQYAPDRWQMVCTREWQVAEASDTRATATVRHGKLFVLTPEETSTSVLSVWTLRGAPWVEVVLPHAHTFAVGDARVTDEGAETIRIYALSPVVPVDRRGGIDVYDVSQGSTGRLRPLHTWASWPYSYGGTGASAIRAWKDALYVSGGDQDEYFRILDARTGEEKFVVGDMSDKTALRMLDEKGRSLDRPPFFFIDCWTIGPDGRVYVTQSQKDSLEVFRQVAVGESASECVWHRELHCSSPYGFLFSCADSMVVQGGVVWFSTPGHACSADTRDGTFARVELPLASLQKVTPSFCGIGDDGQLFAYSSEVGKCFVFV